ncbi:MAG TPA: FtsQ-type POTRA domain-containing protein [Desulfatiglandales bacterium]|nr:FtsQ-type POTRA domain-containing protein [Desulfatiglandales bacterium]
MKKISVLKKQSVKRNRKKDLLALKKGLGQLGFGLIKILLFVVGLGGLSIGLISGYQFLSSSPYLALRNIVVTGVNDDLRKELIEISGITEKDTFLSIDLAKVKKNIEGHPWIKSAFLKKQFPNTLHIQAEDEEATAIILLKKMHLIDKQGEIFKDVESDDNTDLPVVTGLSESDIRNKEYLNKVSSLINSIKTVNTALLSVKELSEINVGEDGDLSIYFNELPFKVFLGKHNLEGKIGSLTNIIKHLQDTHRLYQVKSIDLDYPDRGIVAFINRVA